MDPAVPPEEVTLEDMLAARDRRVARQSGLAARFGVGRRGTGERADADGAVIGVTLVVPGPRKNPPWAQEVFTAAMQHVTGTLAGTEVVHVETHASVAGPEGFVVVSGTAAGDLKRRLVEVEETQPWGRLVDLDVVVDGVPLQRSDIGAQPRRCLVCDGPAAPCARSRAHDLAELDAAIEGLLCS